MKGQRTVLGRGTLALFLCALLLSTFFTTTVFGGKTDPPTQSTPVVTAESDPAEGCVGDGSGNGDPPPDGDPDDYDKMIANVWVMLLEFPLFPLF